MNSVFISYRWEEKDYVEGIAGFLNNPNNDYNWIPKREMEDRRNLGEHEVKKYLREIISPCSALICLVGQNSHNLPWMNWELDVGTSQKKKIVAVRIPDTTGGPPPIIKNRGIPVIEWNARKINEALDK